MTTTTTISPISLISANEFTVWDLELKEGMQVRKVPCNGWWIGHLSAPKHPAQVFKACLQELLKLGVSSNFFYSILSFCGRRHKTQVDKATGWKHLVQVLIVLTVTVTGSLCSHGAGCAAALPCHNSKGARREGQGAQQSWNVLKKKLKPSPNKFCLSILFGHDNWSHWVIFGNWISVSFRLSITREMKRTNSMPKRFGSTSRDMATRNGAAARSTSVTDRVRMIIFHNVIMYSGFKHSNA